MNTITIPLSKGKYAVVDEVDSDLAKFKWFAHRGGPKTRNRSWYALRSVPVGGKYKRVSMHRIIMERIHGPLAAGVVTDHKDRDSLNNRRSNLRLATPLQNSQNKENLRYNNSTGLRGVTRRRKGFDASITIEGKGIYLGNFLTAEEAHAVYKQASIKYCGEFSPYWEDES